MAFPIDGLEIFFEKEEVTILVTDSGLGGLSVCADIETLLKQNPVFMKSRIIYYNAQPSFTLGYNGITDIAEKVRIFDCALEGTKAFDPDIILIACNTLSVIYNETNFSTLCSIPVMGIMEFGVDRLFENLVTDNNSSAIIFGTITTIETGSHKKELVRKGIDADRIINQPCPNLQVAIERGTHSEETKQMIEVFVKEAVGKIGKKTIYAGLCCTHFGYSSDLFLDAFEKHAGGEVQIIDPNIDMACFLVKNKLAKVKSEYKLSIDMLSRCRISDNNINAVASILKKEATLTVDALLNYKLNENLFSF